MIMDGNRGDELIGTLLAAESGDPVVGDASYELMNLMVADAYPANRLGRLLDSHKPAAVRAGAWIASELPALQAGQVLEHVGRLLDSDDPQVRFCAVETVLAGATPRNGTEVAGALARVEDTDHDVRHSAMRLMAWLEADSLAAGLQQMNDSPLRSEIEWLVDEGSDPAAASSIERRLAAPDRRTRFVAAAAATRVAGVDESALEAATQALDDDVASFARQQAKQRLWTRIGGRWR